MSGNSRLIASAQQGPHREAELTRVAGPAEHHFKGLSGQAFGRPTHAYLEQQPRERVEVHRMAPSVRCPRRSVEPTTARWACRWAP